MAVGADGRPVLVFASFPTSSSATDHLYHYARWNGSSWDVRPITPAGGSISTGGRSPLYSGGITLDHDDPSSVYLSRQAGEAWWVEAWKTPDGGATWTSRTLTPDSTQKNVRPLSPRGHEPNGEMVLWMSGAYPNYNTFQTTVTSLIQDPPPPVFGPPAQPPADPAPTPSEPTPTPPGDPSPTPVGPPTTPATPPASDVRLALASPSSRLVRIGPRAGGRLAVRCRAEAADRCKVAGSLRRESGRIGLISGTVRGGRRGTIRVRLTRRSASRLERSRRLIARVVATSSSLSGRGAPVRGRVRLVLRSSR